MRAKELRIGNFVNTNDYINLEVLGISSTNVGLKLECTNFISVDYNELKPIPITVDWLLKLGFEYHTFDKNYVIKTKDNWHNSIKKIDGDWCYNNDFSDAACYFVTDIKYVHQLQNMYYVLNEEELICK